MGGDIQYLTFHAEVDTLFMENLLQLVIVTRVIEAAGSQIPVQSKPGRGSTLTFRIPIEVKL